MPIPDEKQPLINKELRTDYVEGGNGEGSTGGKCSNFFFFFS